MTNGHATLSADSYPIKAWDRIRAVTSYRASRNRNARLKRSRSWT